MTTYNVSPSDSQSVVQGRINALLPGDTLVFASGTYTTTGWTIGVSGTVNNPITIKGPIIPEATFNARTGVPAWIQTSGTETGTQTALTITGGYLHIAYLNVRKAKNAIVFNGAHDVRLEYVDGTTCSGEGVRIKGNSHHIVLWFVRMIAPGLSAPTTARMTRPFVVGSPNSEWANSNSPDRTNNVFIGESETYVPRGSSFTVWEGSYRVLLRACSSDMDFVINEAGDLDPPVGGQWGDCAYESWGDDVQFMQNTALRPSNHVYQCFKITVGATTYGSRNKVYGGASRDPGISHFASDSNDFRVYNPFFLGDNPNYPVIWYDVYDNSNWYLAVPADPAYFVPIEIGGPATRYNLWPLPYGQYRPLMRFTGQDAHNAVVAKDPNTCGTVGNVVYSSEDNARLVGVASWRILAGYDPTLMRLWKSDYAIDPYFTEKQYIHTELDPNYYYIDPATGLMLKDLYPQIYQAALGARDLHDLLEAMNARLPLLTRNLTWQNPSKIEQWDYAYFADPVPLERNRQVCVSVLNPGGFGGQNPPQRDSLLIGLAQVSFWSYGWGTWGLTEGPVVMPPNAALNPNTNEYTRYGTTGFIQSTGGVAGDSGTPAGTEPDALLLGLGLSIGGGGVFLVDPIVSTARTTPITTTVTPGMDLQTVLDTSIPGDVIIISGVHEGDFVTTQAGTPAQPITIKGDGTAILRSGFWPQTAVTPNLRVVSNNIYLRNIIFEQAYRGVVIENGVSSVRVEACTARQHRFEGFIAQESCADIYFLTCTTSDTGLDSYYGEGIRIGRQAGYWASDLTPDNCTRVVISGCSVTRNYGNGITAHDGCADVLVTGCAVNYSGVFPAPDNVSGGSGYHSRADRIQFVGCTVTNAPSGGFTILDSTWSIGSLGTGTYGRSQEIKGGSATNCGDAGVITQADDLKIYSDFTVTGSPRYRVIEGPWGAGSSAVDPAQFRAKIIDSVAQGWPPA